MQYLHSMQLVHGDIKMENILLKSDAARRLGFTPKARRRAFTLCPARVARAPRPLRTPACAARGRPRSARPCLQRSRARANAPPSPQLADFGLSKVLGQGAASVINLSGAGTVTHLAPEMFQAGSRVTTAVDVYAFGIFMYELYTRKVG